jgi:hypothetical protein
MKEWRNKKTKERKQDRKRKNGDTEEKKDITNTSPWCRFGPRVWLDQGIMQVLPVYVIKSERIKTLLTPRFDYPQNHMWPLYHKILQTHTAIQNYHQKANL